MNKNKISIIGTVGVPANYGGFETLVESLVKYHKNKLFESALNVYCSSKSYQIKPTNYLSAKLKYIPLKANGPQSVFYDILSLLSSIWNRSNVVLVLGVSGAIVLPLVRQFSSVRIVTNIDGIEWRRDKWKGLGRKYLRFSEKIAVRFSHEVIADNLAIAEYVKQTYQVDTHVIAYGGDHCLQIDCTSVDEYHLPFNYSFSVCRIEPENNIHLILQAFSKLTSNPLVIVGNWSNSDYGRELRKLYAPFKNLYLLDPIYDLGKLKTLRTKALVYIHGHSAGGTNPSLVEAMHFGKPIIAFDCNFNRFTTEDKALFFKTSNDLISLVKYVVNKHSSLTMGANMFEIAQRRYRWDVVAEQYFSLLNS